MIIMDVVVLISVAYAIYYFRAHHKELAYSVTCIKEDLINMQIRLEKVFKTLK